MNPGAQAEADQCLAAIELLNDQLNAVISRADAPRKDGVPLLVKDCIDVAGLPTTHGSAIFRDAPPATHHAPVVARALEAGACVLGKAHLSEFCFGATGENTTFGDCRNPWNPEHITGGSSSGSAGAVAAGLTRVALGTDTGGSVRVPAALCGVVGLRPTLGRVSNSGCLAVSTISDTIGPLGRTVRDAAWLYDAIRGFDATDPLSIAPGPAALPTLENGIAGLRVGLLGGYFREGLAADIEAGLSDAARALEAAGAAIVDLQPEDDAALREHHAFRFILADVAEARAPIMADPSLRAQLGPEVRRRIELGQNITGMEYAASIRALQRLRRWLRNVFSRDADVLLCATTPITAPAWAASRDMVETTRRVAGITYDLGATGTPSLSVPMGLDGNVLPMGAMLVAPWEQDALVLQVGRTLERALDLQLRPPLCGLP